MAADLAEKVQRVQELVRAHQPLLVAYSGGVDSATLLALACETPGAQVRGVLADSPSLPRQALARALAEATSRQWPVTVISTQEMADPRYTANPPNRCYYCKAELFARMEAYAREQGFHHLAYGENAEDVAAERPGSQAAAEFCVLAPLRQAGLGKAEVRQLARERHLSMAETPAQPCLSSRLRYGVPVTAEALALVERAEAALAAKGFRVYRMRHLGIAPGSTAPRGLVQVAPEEIPRLRQEWTVLAQQLLALGFAQVEWDEQGYRGPSLS